MSDLEKEIARCHERIDKLREFILNRHRDQEKLNECALICYKAHMELEGILKEGIGH